MEISRRFLSGGSGGVGWWYIQDHQAPATWQWDQQCNTKDAVGALESVRMCFLHFLKEHPPAYPETLTGVCCIVPGLPIQK